MAPHISGARVAAPFDEVDLRRLDATLARAASLATADPAALLPPAASAAARSIVRRTCTFAHCAVLLFPTDLDVALEYLAERSLDPLPPSPSVLVRRRLTERHRLSSADCHVVITGLRPRRMQRHAVEVFLFAQSDPAWSEAVAATERAFGLENHLAFDVARPHERLLGQLVTLLAREMGLVWEGGGHNPHEGRRGTTVFYFVGRRSQRWELRCEGDLSAVVERLPVDAARVRRTYASWPAGGQLATSAV